MKSWLCTRCNENVTLNVSESEGASEEERYGMGKEEDKGRGEEKRGKEVRKRGEEKKGEEQERGMRDYGRETVRERGE